MRRKKVLLAGGAALAALALFAPLAVADPVGAPIPRPLSAGGSDTTQEVMNDLAGVVVIGGVKQLGSYNATGTPDPYITKAGCSIPRARTNGSTNGTNALQDALEGVADVIGTGGVACFDFARSSALNPASFPSTTASSQLSWVPFARDAVTYATRDDSQIPDNLAVADLKSIYDCLQSTADFRPVLPQVGSGTRSFFLGQLGYTTAQIATFETDHQACLNLDFPINPVTGLRQGPEEHRGNTLTNPQQIMPYSIAVNKAQFWGPAQPLFGRAVLRRIADARPTFPNPLYTGGITIAKRADSQIPDLSTADLQSIYTCGQPITDFHPVIPSPNTGAVANALYDLLAVPAAQRPGFVAAHACINVDFPGRVGPTENQGNQLTVTNPNVQLMPHSISSYLDQLWGGATDRRGVAILRPISFDGGATFPKPALLNTAFPFARDVYNVIPTNKETTAPWSTVFVDSNPSPTVNTSLICQQSTAILNQGFGAISNCGSIAARSTVTN